MKSEKKVKTFTPGASKNSIDRASKIMISFIFIRGCSSAGRAQPCQGWGRGFESRRPLHRKASFACQTFHLFINGGVPKWLRERSAKPRCSGSSPLAASTFIYLISIISASMLLRLTNPTVALPYNQLPASPGLISSVLPIFFIKALCVCPKITIS